MIKAGVRIENMEGFDAQINEVVAAVEANLNEVAEIVFNEAKTTSAFADKTGNLRSSIKKRKSKFENGGYIVEASGKGSAKGYHAANVEFGHVLIVWGHPTGKRVPPHPFMRPALEVGLQRAITLFRSKK